MYKSDYHCFQLPNLFSAIEFFDSVSADRILTDAAQATRMNVTAVTFHDHLAAITL